MQLHTFTHMQLVCINLVAENKFERGVSDRNLHTGADPKGRSGGSGNFKPTLSTHFIANLTAMEKGIRCNTVFRER